MQRQREFQRAVYPQYNQHFGVGSSLPNGYVAYNIEGQLCQWINGSLVPLQITQQGPILFVPSPNYPFPSLPAAVSAIGAASTLYPIQPAMNSQSSGLPTGTPSTTASMIDLPDIDVETQIQLLRKQYEKLTAEKIEHERREVKIKDKLPPIEREMMIQQKRQYITDLDKIRRTIKKLEDSNDALPPNAAEFQLPLRPAAPYYVQPHEHGPSMVSIWAPLNGFNPARDFGVEAPTNIAFNPQLDPETYGRQHPTHLQRDFGVDDANAMQYPTQGRESSIEALEAATDTRDKDHEASPQSHTKQAPYKSHAIPIKNPQTGVTTNTSALDPTSPVYEPGKRFSSKSDSQGTIHPSIDSPLTWHERKTRTSETLILPGTKNVSSPATDAIVHINLEDTLRSMLAGETRRQYDHKQQESKASVSSAATADFFPTNAQEHSFSKYMERVFANRTNSSSGEHSRTALNTPAKESHHKSGYPAPTMLPSPNTPFELKPPRCPQPSPVNPKSTLLSNERKRSLEVPVHLDIRYTEQVMDLLQRTKDPNDVVSEQQPDTTFSSPDRIVQKHHDGSFDSPEEKNEYFDGYRAGSAGHAPRSTRSSAYVSGYCDGLMKTRAHTSGRSLSTISVKSEAFATNAASEGPSPPRFLDRGVAMACSADRASNERPQASAASRNENMRSASRTTNYTPTRHQIWTPEHKHGCGAHSAEVFNIVCEPRILSGSLHTLGSAHGRSVHKSRGVSNTSSDTAPPLSATRLYHDAVHSARLVRTLSERSPNIPANDRASPGSHGILRGDDLNSVYKAKIQNQNMAGFGHTSRDLSLSYDGALDDLQEMAEAVPSQTATAPPTTLPSRPHDQQILGSSPTKPAAASNKSRPSTTARAMPEPDSESETQSKSCSPRRHSPTKIRLSQAMRNVFASKSSQDQSDHGEQSTDPTMTDAEQKHQKKSMWKQRFKDLKAEEQEKIDKYRRNNLLPK